MLHRPAFKGFADSPTSITCGAGGSTRPGNSALPPPTLPSRIQVLCHRQGAEVRFGDHRHDPPHRRHPGRQGLLARSLATREPARSSPRSADARIYEHFPGSSIAHVLQVKEPVGGECEFSRCCVGRNGRPDVPRTSSNQHERSPRSPPGCRALKDRKPSFLGGISGYGSRSRPVRDGALRGAGRLAVFWGRSPKLGEQIVRWRHINACKWACFGRLAQLGEHQLDKLGVTGSSPVPPTRKPPLARGFSSF